MKALLSRPIMWGYSFGAKIAGLVSDPRAAVIPRVTVTVMNEGTGAHRRLVTDGSGMYVATELPVGYYTVRFEASGFAPLERGRVKVDVGGETRVDASPSGAQSRL